MNAYWKRGLRVSGQFSELGQSLTSAVTAGNIAETGGKRTSVFRFGYGQMEFSFSVFYFLNEK